MYYWCILFNLYVITMYVCMYMGLLNTVYAKTGIFTCMYASVLC